MDKIKYIVVGSIITSQILSYNYISRTFEDELQIREKILNHPQYSILMQQYYITQDDVSDASTRIHNDIDIIKKWQKGTFLDKFVSHPHLDNSIYIVEDFKNNTSSPSSWFT